MKRTELRRLSPLRSYSTLRRSARAAAAKPKRSHERDPVPLSTRKVVWARSGGLCECGCGQRAVHIHHRKLRSQGGSNDPTNLAHLSTEHHVAAHANPQLAVEFGLIVPGWADPAAVPIRQGAFDA